MPQERRSPRLKRYVSPTEQEAQKFTERYPSSRGFDQYERDFLRRVATGEKRTDSSYGPLVALLNPKLLREGETISVVGGKYVMIRTSPTRSNGNVVRFGPQKPHGRF